MWDEQRQCRIEAAAATALMLQIGDGFRIPVDGDEDYAESCVERLEDALEREYVAGKAIVDGLAEPDEITAFVITTSSGSTSIVVNRPGDAEDHRD